MSYESQLTKLRKQKQPIPQALRDKANEEIRLRRRKRKYKLKYQVKIILPNWWAVDTDFKNAETIYPLGNYE